MEKFKTVSFVVFDEKGAPHRIQMDRYGDEHPEYLLRGSAAELLSEWKRVARMVELHLSANQEKTHEWGFRHAEMP